MHRELIANNIFVFTSELYAQVTAGAILTPEGAIVIDTLAFPRETQAIIRFIEGRHSLPVRYVINTHYHADHTNGTSLFEDAEVISHKLCADLLDTKGREGLRTAQRSSREFQGISTRIPDVTFEDRVLNLTLGDVTLQMWHAPGHSPDLIMCLVTEPGILFASDAVLEVPFFVDGSWAQNVETLESIDATQFNAVVQGHGPIVLKGELPLRLRSDINYLNVLREKIEVLIASGGSEEDLEQISLEDCGKSRTILNGVGLQLHTGNRVALYRELTAETG